MDVVPSVRELFSISRASGPYAYVIREILRHAEEAGPIPPIFRPWCPIDAAGEPDGVEMGKLFDRWSAEEYSLPPIERLCLPVPLALEMEKEELGMNRAVDALRHAHVPPILALMKDLPTEEGWYPHHACRELGSVHMFGGWRSDFDQSAKLCGPCILGCACRIRYGARLSWSVLGHGVRVAGRVSRSMIGDGTTIEPGAVIGDSLIGKNCLIGASVVLRSHDALVSLRKEIITQDSRVLEPSAIPTGRTVFGCVIGDGCVVLASLCPGTVLGKNCKVTMNMQGRLSPGIYSREVLEEIGQTLAADNEDLRKRSVFANQLKNTKQ